ncbi:MAG: methyltransferase domain-containing protein [Anaerolineales bacterium]|nr:methyltransferase domain-containing protein [Anaerolineales bacterium]
MSATHGDLRAALIQALYRNGSLHDARVAEAFRAVPRHVFLPDVTPEAAYQDEAIPTKYAPDGTHAISSSSQPSIMAIMLEQLDVQPGQRLLEIGAGTGYNAALLAFLAGPHGQVTTLDLDEDVVAAAREHLAAAGFGEVAAITADGAEGFPPGAPYDGIILTVGAWDVAPAWHSQLRPGGRLVLPLEIASGAQKSAALVKPAAPEASGRWFISEALRNCGFMPLRGALAQPEYNVALGPEAGLSAFSSAPLAADGATLYDWLQTGGRAEPTGSNVTEHEAWGSWNLWFGLHAADMTTLVAIGAPAESGQVPRTLGYRSHGQATTVSSGLVTAGGCCWLGRGPDSQPDRQMEGDHPFELYCWKFGPDPARAEARLLGILAGWEAAKRPGTDGLTLEVFDRAAPPPTLPGAGAIVEKPATRLRLTYAPPAR